MLGRHQVPAHVLTSPHEVSGRLLFNAGNPHLHDFTQMQQPGQVPGIAGRF